MVQNLVRKEVRNIKPYVVKDEPYEFLMNSNESPFQLPQSILKEASELVSKLTLNRYPDPNALDFRSEVSKYANIPVENIMAGNGSDELIGIILNTFVGKGDYVVTHGPTFAMYKIYTEITGGAYKEVPSKDNYEIDVDGIIAKANAHRAKVVFLCTPNNPTGAVISKGDILKVAQEVNAMVVVDEAYFEFGGESVLSEIKQKNNLIVMRTLSKGIGVAGLRLGYLCANKQVIDFLSRVKPPYNLNAISQAVGITVLKNSGTFTKNIGYLLNQRESLFTQLQELPNVKVYPSQGNFILISTPLAPVLVNALENKGIKVRLFSEGTLKDHIRVTIGLQRENQIFVDTIKDVLSAEEELKCAR